MIVLLDTATDLCRLIVVDHGGVSHQYSWQARRTLARHLLRFLRDRLAEHGAELSEITGIGVLRGPGSFTGLRIGLTVANTLADGLQVPIVGTTGSDWQDQALKLLQQRANHRIVLPHYAAPARITKPRK